MPRVVRHKHWPEDHPFYERAEWHYVTKGACDVLWTQYLHGHEGRECVKAIQPSKSKRGRMNTIATCILEPSPPDESGTLNDTTNEELEQ